MCAPWRAAAIAARVAPATRSAAGAASPGSGDPDRGGRGGSNAGIAIRPSGAESVSDSITRASDDPVGDAVVHADDHRRPVAETVDHVGVPQRPGAVQRHGHQVADQLLQRGAIAGRRQRKMVHVVLEREVWVVLPAAASASGSRLSTTRWRKRG